MQTPDPSTPAPATDTESAAALRRQAKVAASKAYYWKHRERLQAAARAHYHAKAAKKRAAAALAVPAASSAQPTEAAASSAVSVPTAPDEGRAIVKAQRSLDEKRALIAERARAAAAAARVAADSRGPAPEGHENCCCGAVIRKFKSGLIGHRRSQKHSAGMQTHNPTTCVVCLREPLQAVRCLRPIRSKQAALLAEPAASVEPQLGQ